MKQFLLHMLLGLLAGVGLAIAFFAALIWADRSISAYGADLPDIQIQPAGYEPVKVIAIIDGDTIRVPIFDGSRILNAECFSKRTKMATLSIRVYGVDTPESIKPPAKCAAEVARGLRAKEFVKKNIKAGDTILIKHIPGEKYQCRIDAEILFGPLNQNLTATLIAAKLARPYGVNGNLKKSNWCK
jgi:endonuclease YncB( thermonuclease family)